MLIFMKWNFYNFFNFFFKFKDTNKKPVAKPRTNIPIKTKPNDIPILSPKPSDGKPPLPVTIMPPSDNSYLSISQKRKEFIEKFRNRGNAEFLTSPKSPSETKTQLNEEDNSKQEIFIPSVNIQTQHNSAVNKVQSNSQNNYTESQHHQLLDKPNVEVFQKNVRKPDNLINTFNNKYGSNNQEITQHHQLTSANNNNNHNSNNKPPVTKFNYTKVENNNNNNNSEKLNNENNSQYQLPAAGNAINHNYTFEMKKYQPQVITRTYTNANSVIEIQQLGPMKRPYSANTPLTNENIELISNAITQNNIVNNNNSNNAHVPKINTKFMNLNGTIGPNTPQRILSADSCNQHFRYRKYFNKYETILISIIYQEY